MHREGAIQKIMHRTSPALEYCDLTIIIAPKAHLHSSAKDGLGVPGFPYVRVTLILGFFEIFEFSVAEMESGTVDSEATIGSGWCPGIVGGVLVVIGRGPSH